MKRIIVLICLAYSTNSFSQNVNYKDLLGSWYIDSIDNANVYHLFIKDSTHFIVQGERGYVTYIYKLDTTKQLLLAFEMKKYSYKLKKWLYYKSEEMINIISKDELIDRDSNEIFKRIN